MGEVTMRMLYDPEGGTGFVGRRAEIHRDRMER
jgi:hypothetical protein